MNGTFDGKPAEADRKKASSPSTNHSQKIASFFPTILFAICFLAARTGLLSAMEMDANLVLLIAATLTTLFVTAQRLPLQNVFGIAVTIAIFSGVILLITTGLKLPFVAPLLNQSFARLDAWTFPLLWIIALINARGVAKLLLHRWRKKQNFGLWLIALSSLMVATLNPRIFLTQFVLALVAFVTVTPWFIDKKRAEFGPDYQPLLITVLLLLW